MSDRADPHASAMPEVIVFDLGKVLVDFDYHIAARAIAARGRVAALAVQKFIEHAPLLFRYETGQMTSQAFFEEVCQNIGFAGSFDEFARFFADIFTPIPEMVELHGRLRARGFATLILSNTNELAAGHIRRQFPFFSRFDGYVLSYEHGCMKPDLRLYQVVERMTGKTERQLLFVDDRLENAEAAGKLGWHWIHHQSPNQTRERMQALGLPV
jgi:FMN phosphatase YigB (HAD superfamily)